MASTAAYSGLRWGELTALTIGQIDQAGRVITVDRKVIEVAGHLYIEAPKNRKSLTGLARGQACGGMLVLGGQGCGVIGSVDALAVAGRLVQHGDRLAGLAGRDQRAAEADLGRDGAGMIGSQDVGASGRHPPEPGHGLSGLPGCQQRAGQQAARQDRVGVAWAEEPVAAGGQLPPPGDRRAG